MSTRTSQLSEERRSATQLSEERRSATQLSEERGSAIAEFLLVALPLLLPAVLFFLAMNQSAKVNMNASLIARQAVAAFTSGQDDRQAHARVQTLINEYRKLDPAIASIDYRVTCQAHPCITPGAAVELLLEVHFRTANIGYHSKAGGSGGPGNFVSEQRAVGFIDKWR